MAHTNRHILNGGLDAITYMAAGDRSKAIDICNTLEASGAMDVDAPLTDDDGREARRQRRDVCRLIALDDRVGFANLLHEREKQSVIAWKMEKYWEKSPFPFQE
jgi:DNA polymerase III delta prime subunit